MVKLLIRYERTPDATRGTYSEELETLADAVTRAQVLLDNWSTTWTPLKITMEVT